ncbi:hypothetical protein Scep_018537 [Stephania cephalantha]|uniref:Protein kinase domain-containing protein n=1 Tax=Stephania cephalantha TaxID=152367 RepID=A0AAP0I9G1_9MAGN
MAAVLMLLAGFMEASGFGLLRIAMSESYELQFPFYGCQEKCGDLQVSYPFGIGEGCFFPGFQVICKQGTPYLAVSDFEVVEISQGEVRVKSDKFTTIACLTEPLGNGSKIEFTKDGPFTICDRSNSYTVVGCNALGKVLDVYGADTIKLECRSTCPIWGTMENGICTGIGCCQVPLPRIQNSMLIFAGSGVGEAPGLPSSNCSRAFVMEGGGYNFIVSDAWNFNGSGKFPVKLNWTIKEGHCEADGMVNQGICGVNSYCEQSKSDIINPGYLCKCLEGYEGNPYLNGSRGCHASIFCVGLVCSYSYLYWLRKKRLLVKMRAEYFRRNGGVLLQQYICSDRGIATKCVRIFSTTELEKATNNYNCCQILGCGGEGTVYKGILKDGKVVAIKKSQFMKARGKVDRIVNELVVLSQINHRNIVKLIGCCLETEIPLLVYEFISGGTLYQKLHQDRKQSVLHISWKDRLRIAIEVGEALSYLHSFASTPIFHRDVKSSNILLNEHNTAKLADFGLSRLVSIDEVRVSTAVMGTIGYLDPEYYNTGQLTEKSDVYSFGVVLLELLTGRKPVRHEETRDYSSLVMHFQSHVGSHNIFEILDERIVGENYIEEMRVAAEIACKCLNGIGALRPTMKTVVKELASIASES